MLTRRLVLRALLTGVAALGWPAGLAAQPSATLPLRDARALVFVDAWHGFSAISPTQTTYSLQRSADGSFAGTVQITVGAGLLRRDTSLAVHLPRSAVDSLLQVLSDAPLQESFSYQPTFTHTDDYPTITVDLTVGDSVVRFHTTSQGEAHVPWQVSAGGRTYVSGSEAIWSTLSAVLGRIGRGPERALMEAARNDPESQCGHNRRPPLPGPPRPERPRYAGGEAWFARDSTITVQGTTYHKHGPPRVVGLHEISAYGTYRGVTVFQEMGLEGTPDVVYVPVRASCEVQAYFLERRP
ncbi:MAG TPA: hypothetical protein VEQ60_01215 [Longimicrobium sp.]|nr:hypothetical protein [Longimicrobium sp.]